MTKPGPVTPWMVLLLVCGPARAADEVPQVPAPASTPHFVIIQPGYPGSTKDAEGFVSSLAKYVEEHGALKGLSGEYHNEPRAALEAISRLKPLFGVVSLGFYLEHRKDLGLQPLLESRPADNFVLVAREGEIKDLGALKGQIVAGGPLHELPFLDRIALAGKAELSSWESKPVLNTSRTLRELVDKKKYAAVLLTGREYRSFAPLYQTKRLEKLLETEYYPPAFLVAFGEKPQRSSGASQNDTAGEDKSRDSTSKDREEALPAKPVEDLRGKPAEIVKRAFSGLAEDPKGKKILETMGAEGFGEIKKDSFQELEGKYAAREKK